MKRRCRHVVVTLMCLALLAIFIKSISEQEIAGVLKTTFYSNTLRPIPDSAVSISDQLSMQHNNAHVSPAYSNQPEPKNSTTVSADDYFVPGKRIITKYTYNFIIKGEDICNDFHGTDDGPTVIILIMSVVDHKQYRDGIRATWASGEFPDEKHSGVEHQQVRRRDILKHQGKSLQQELKPVKSKLVNSGPWRGFFRHVFLFGMLEKGNGNLEKLRNESAEYGDIVVADFVESYFNLTRKVISGFLWSSKYCPQATHVAKVDEDTFLHIPRLYHRMLLPEWNSAIGGPLFPSCPVSRKGKFAVAKESYPLPKYPSHVKGNIYWMPASVSEEIASVAPYMPYVNVEDTFVTVDYGSCALGILGAAVRTSLFVADKANDWVAVSDAQSADGVLAKIVGAYHIGLKAEDYSTMPVPVNVCEYRKTKKMASQQTTPTLAREIWKTVYNDSICRPDNEKKGFPV